MRTLQLLGVKKDKEEKDDSQTEKRRKDNLKYPGCGSLDCIMYVHVYVCICVYEFMCMNVCYVCVYIYIHIYTQKEE